MITNKDVRVENGNLVLNGDKYPLDGQSPEAIMQIVEDNSDTTPTENSDAPITSGGVFTALAGKEDTLTFDTAPTAESANPVTSAGIKTYVDTAVGYFDKTINAETSGHGAPTRSSGGAYYEPLVDYNELGVTRDKILSVSLINWTGVTKEFTPYIGTSTVSAITNTETSIYANDPGSNIVLRFAYTR